MCLIVTLVMFFFAVQNLMAHQWLDGGTQLVIALGFLLLLIRNIRLTHCERNGNCGNVCMLPKWLTKYFKKGDI